MVTYTTHTRIRCNDDARSVGAYIVTILTVVGKYS